MRPFRNKTNRIWTRCLAFALLICCVLAIVPAQLFAKWSIRGHSASPQAGMSSSGGDLNIQYKFFGDNLYIPGEGSTTTYYQYDANADDYKGAVISGVSNKDDAMKKVAVTTHDTHTGSEKNMKNPYCAGHSLCTYSGTDCTYSDSYTMAKSEVGGFADVSFSFNISPNFNIYEYGQANGITTSGQTKVYDFTYETQTETREETFEETVDGKIVTRKVYFVASATPDLSVLVKCTAASEHSALFQGKSMTYRYSGTATYTLDVTYQIVVEETVAGSVHQNVPNGQIAEGAVLYTVGGYSQGDVIYAPASKTLINALPNNETYGNVQAAAKAIRGFYNCTEGEDANGNKTVVKGDPVSFPLTMSESSITVWVEVGMLHTLAADKTNLNTSIGNMGASDSITLAGESMASSQDITNDIAYIGEDDAFGLLAAEINGTLNLAFKFVDKVADSTGGTYSPRLEVDVNKNVTNVKDTYVMQGKNGLTDQTLGLANNTRDYTVVLQNDVTVNGTLNLGGYTGVSAGTGANKAQFYIINNYVALDLNGHTLTVDGTFNSYGYIYDSVGTGKIVISPNGTFCTQLALYGIGGIQHMMRAYDGGCSPFEDYNMPYVNATVELQSSGTNSATMYGYTLIYPMGAQEVAGVGGVDAVICNYYMKMFGDDRTQAEDGLPLFKMSQKTSGEESKTVISTKEIAGLSTLSTTGLNVKNTFEFVNQTVDFCPPTLSFSVTAKLIVSVTETAILDLRRVIFPISPMVDVAFCSSEISIGQPIMVLPGSTLTFDEKSTLKLVNGGTFTQSDSLSLPVLNVPFYTSTTKNLTGAVYAPTYELQSTATSQVSLMGQKVGLAFGTYESKNFWKQFGASQVNIYGTVEFASGTLDPIVLSGNINIHQFKGVDANGNACLYRWNETSPDQLSARLPAGVKLATYGTLTVPATMDTGKTSNEGASDIAHYYVSPLISNGVAYLYNNSSVTSIASNSTYAYLNTCALSGSYDAKTGIFTDAATSNRYVILPTPTLPAYKSQGLIKITHSVKAISDASNGMVKIVENGTAKYYVHYAGIFVPTVTTTSIVDDAGAWAITSTTSQCTVSTNFFRSSGYYSKDLILTWNGTFWTHQIYDTATKKWYNITWSADAKDWYYRTSAVTNSDGTKTTTYYLAHGGTYEKTA